jgi:hypothetical protein
MQYLQAVHIVALLLATIAIVVAVTRGIVDAWRDERRTGSIWPWSCSAGDTAAA